MPGGEATTKKTVFGIMGNVESSVFGAWLPLGKNQVISVPAKQIWTYFIIVSTKLHEGSLLKQWIPPYMCYAIWDKLEDAQTFRKRKIFDRGILLDSHKGICVSVI